MKKSILIVVLMLMMTVSSIAGEKQGIDVILESYDAARLTLVEDSTEGVAAHGAVIATAAGQIRADFSSGRAGVADKSRREASELLAEIEKAGSALAKTSDLASAREAYHGLTSSLLKYRQLLTGDRPAVAHCPMVARKWLQPDGEIGNPYAGQSMPKCGQIVER